MGWGTFSNSSERMSVVEGDFSKLKMNDHMAMMLSDAYEAITRVNGWEFLKSYEPEAGKGFLFSKGPEKLEEINGALKYEGHSGSSHAWTMRVMEMIAKKGWLEYVKSVGVKECGPLEVAEALAKANPSVFGGQAEAMRKFSEGKLTYAEMRGLCG